MKKLRNTQKKRIIHAKTWNERLAWSRDGQHGPDSPIERLVMHALMTRDVLADPSFYREHGDKHLPEREKANLEREFCDKLLPALMNNDQESFHELTAAMGRMSKIWKGELKRKEDRLRLRLSLMFPGPNITREVNLNTGAVTSIEKVTPKSMSEIRARINQSWAPVVIECKPAEFEQARAFLESRGIALEHCKTQSGKLVLTGKYPYDLCEKDYEDAEIYRAMRELKIPIPKRKRK